VTPPALGGPGELNRLFERVVATATANSFTHPDGNSPTTVVVPPPAATSDGNNNNNNNEGHLPQGAAGGDSPTDKAEDQANNTVDHRDGDGIMRSDEDVAATTTTTTLTSNYKVRIYSSPGVGGARSTTVAHHRAAAPWVIALDDFLTEEECEAFIQFGHYGTGQQQEQQQQEGSTVVEGGFQRSVDVGHVDAVDGTVHGRRSDVRTSETFWCTKGIGCRTAPVPERLHRRISALMGIPTENSEDFQILKYEVGQCA
jgi:hypothetical protein